MKWEQIDERWFREGKERLILQNYTSSIGGSDITIPIHIRHGEVWGFCTDGGTIPPIAWPITGHPFGRFFFPFLNHDGRWSLTPAGMTFADTNDLLYTDLLYYGASKKLAWAIKKAVDIGGSGIWNRGRQYANDIDFHYAPM